MDRSGPRPVADLTRGLNFIDLDSIVIPHCVYQVLNEPPI
jgi:hypothetical protein